MPDVFAEITVLIADRATLFRHGLRGLLKEHRPGWSCAEAETQEELTAYLTAEAADLLLFDIQIGGVAGLQRLRQDYPQQKIVVLSDCNERAAILDSLTAGANGYVLKSTSMSQLLRALEIVLHGGVFAPAALVGATPAAKEKAAEAPVSPLLAHLTDRQVEVFQLLSEGCSTKTIARRMGLAIGTVKVHLAAIYRVLGAHSRIEALAKARGAIALPVVERAAQMLAA
ncbi:MAG TPA: response regulator transcription factor [Acetobacteraceae bacterium]|jgi:DNA-binding NarL/FixJ family response regulator|nr:response regulator transcription factor [Acetobacteraceae bacterium]